MICARFWSRRALYLQINKRADFDPQINKRHADFDPRINKRLTHK